MDRRSFLGILQTKMQQSALRTQKVTSGLSQYAGTWDTAHIRHLLKRTMFGATPADIAYFQTKTMVQSVDELLTAAPAPAPPLNNYSYNNPSLDDVDAAYGTTWVNTPLNITNPLVNNARIESFKDWWTGLMLNQNRSITEKMTLFWHNHLATEADQVQVSQAIYNHNALLRQYALGNFKAFVKVVTLDPAMLRYLNGNLNSVGAPDENYARELQELFTIGKSPAALYTEDDVKAAAKVLTGFRYNVLTTPFTTYFDPNKHDTNDKQFSAFYNNTLIQGLSGNPGQTELDALLDMIFATNECALFICRKIYTFFVYYKIDATTETNIIVPLADIFRTANYDILPVLDALFKSDHFYDMMEIGCVIKEPLDFIIGVCREFQVAFPDNSNINTQYNAWKAMMITAKNMGQDPGDPPNVAGWPAYYQTPMFHEIWINSDTFPRRTGFTDKLINGFTQAGVPFALDPIPFTLALSNPDDPNVLVQDAVNILYSMDISQTSRDFFKAFLLQGQTTDSYWTTAWVDYSTTPTNDVNFPMYEQIVKTRLKALYQSIFLQAEYQLS